MKILPLTPEVSMPVKSLRERLEAKIIRRGEDECWPWRGIDWERIYGKIRDDSNVLQRATRMIYETFVGPIPEGREICHTCDHPGCSNYLKHLFPGTHAENIQDASRKKRLRVDNQSGLNNPRALTEEVVKQIKYLLRPSNGLNQRDIAKIVGVSQSTVWRISTGKTYKK
jgi:predicted XRE-type DNA-binding protein